MCAIAGLDVYACDPACQVRLHQDPSAITCWRQLFIMATVATSGACGMLVHVASGAGRAYALCSAQTCLQTVLRQKPCRGCALVGTHHTLSTPMEFFGFYGADDGSCCDLTFTSSANVKRRGSACCASAEL
jgi:hypothetical protein